MALEALFGKNLVKKMGAEAKDDVTVDTTKALAGKKQIGIYFSAHWCPPCRGFTPVLTEEYKKISSAGFEIVFASSDNDRATCKSYFESMGDWLTLPYDDRALKEKLSKKYKVQGIPTLVLLNDKGELLTTKGRSFVGNKPFPYQPPTVTGALGAKLLKKEADGKVTEVNTQDALAGKNVALYFSAHWCGPCRAFTPSLSKLYNNMKQQVKDGKREDDFEFVFVSSDKDSSGFDSYYGEMPWLALPYSNRDGKADLSSIFDVRGIPTLVTLDPKGRVINKAARGAADSDSTGAEFPWYPKAVNDVNAVMDGLNEETCVIVFLDGASAADAAKRKANLMQVGKKYYDDAKRTGDDSPYRFFYADKNDGIAKRIRALTDVTGPKTIVLNIPDNGGFHLAATEGDVQATLTAFKDGKLARKQLKS